MPDGSGRLALRLKTRWRDGTTHVLIEPADLIDRLVPLIPPPRAHQVRYHGILAPGASLRSRVVPGHMPDTARADEQLGEARAPRPETGPGAPEASTVPPSKARRMRWADLLMRVFAVFPPSLVLHGVEDSIVPIDHARRYAERLADLRIPCRLVEYPDMNHAFWKFLAPVGRFEETVSEMETFLRSLGLLD